MATNSRAGWPVGAFYGYQLDGVFQNEGELSQYPKLGTQVVGDLRFHDTNGDGVITPDDRTLIGNPTPDVIYSFSAGLEFAGIDLSVEFNGQAGNELVNAKRMGRFGLYNFESVYLDRWHGEGTSNTYPSSKGIRKSWNQRLSDYWVDDGGFWRIQNVQLAYNVQGEKVFGAGAPDFRVSFTADRPLSVFDYNGFTAEIPDGVDRQTYPIPAVYTVGLNVKF